MTRWLARLALTPLLLIAGLNVLALAVGNHLPRQTIAFVSDRDGESKIYLMDIAYHFTRKLSDQRVLSCCLEWSPDGEQIAFLSLDGSSSKIYIVDADGGNLRRLTRDPRTNEDDPAWSPDAEHIAFVFISLLSARSAIYVADRSGQDIHPLADNFANDYGPVWSPDGTKILFVSNLSSDGRSLMDRPELFTINADGSGRQSITHSMGQYWIPAYPVYSPDGGQIIFMATPGGYFPLSLYRINADGTEPLLIADNLTTNSPSGWSPDGTRIAVLGDNGGDSDIYTIDNEGRDPQRLTDNPAMDWQPAWSPDGHRILFVSQRDDSSEVYVMDSDGGNLRRLTDSPNLDTYPVWQPSRSSR
jgi:Tol biopolymer transport system component